MPGTALFGLRRHDPDLLGQRLGNLFQHLEARRIDAVIIGDEDARA